MTTFVPVADTYVSQAHPTSNYGTKSTLRTDASPSVMRSYLRFNVTGLSGTITKASLRLYASSSNSVGISVAPVPDTGWSETAMTWSNAPTLAATAGTSGGITSGTWASVDVTSLVKGAGLLSVAVTSPSSTATSLASRESGSSGPQLVVTVDIPTTTTTAPSAVDAQPSFPIRGAFSYPWFPEAWNQQAMNPFTLYHPSLGFYDSSATSVIANQIAAMQYAGMNMSIASWWGQGSPTDGRVPQLLQGAAGTPFRWSLYYEKEGSSDPSGAQLTSDLTYMRDHYGSDPSYLRVNGRFVVFAYADANDGCAMADRWKQANTVGAYVVLKVFPGYTSCASQPDSWHQYSPAVAADSQGSYSYAISPGFWKANEATARLARDPSRWTQNVQAMAASNANFELVTTFNEWGEGTAVESASEWASGTGYGTYLDTLHNVLGSTGGAVSPPSTTTTLGATTSTTVSATTTTSTTVPATTTTSTTTPATTTTTTPAAAGPCGTRTTAPATYNHVLWVWMENHTYTSVIGTAAAPYQTQLANQCGSATNYATVGSPSLPNYIGATAGSTFGIADDNPPSSHALTSDNLFRQVRTLGKTEKSYQESMAASCSLTSSGTYAVKHNPAAYYNGGSDRTACNTDDVPMGTTTSGNFLNDLTNNTLPTFSFITPNLCNDTHDCSVATGDAWLKGWMPKILNSPAYQSGDTAVILVYDEYTSIPNVIISPTTPPGARMTSNINHYALLRTTEDMLGIPTHLGAAATAPTMRTTFNL